MVGVDLLPAYRRPGGRLPADAEDLRQGGRDAHPDELHVDVIGADNRSGTKAAVCHMVEQHGRTRLFYIAGPAEAPDARERRSAFEQAVAEHPGATVAGSFEGRFAAISGQLAVR